MKSTIRRLLFAVVAIAMAMPSLAFKLNDVFSVKGEDGNTLLYQITNANLSNLEVSVNAPRNKDVSIIVTISRPSLSWVILLSRRPISVPMPLNHRLAIRPSWITVRTSSFARTTSMPIRATATGELGQTR